ncbi:MAG: methyltransferase [Myxococcales bacterium]|nr:methyltransferase [Myxococcales bacterium]
MHLARDGDDPLTDDALTSRFRLYQRKRGHRYSLDDVLTAREALRAQPAADRVLDLGCGIGSVLLMLAHALPEAPLVGIEAQEGSFALAARNVTRNGLEGRVRLVHGDLRDRACLASLGGGFGLITGTPPYAPLGTATPSPDPQRAHARVELRGGVEAYLEAAAPQLSPRGRVVVCADARRPERVRDVAPEFGLRPLRRLECRPRAGRAPLFTVWTLGRLEEHSGFECETPEDFVARDEEGRRSDAYLGLRAFFGLPGRK